MDLAHLIVLAVFRRVVLFAEKQWEVLAGVGQGFVDRIAALKAIIQEMDTLVGEHKGGNARNTLEDTNHAVKQLEHVHVLPIIRVARAVGRTVPGVKHLLSTVPLRITKENIMATARGVLSACEPHVDLLAANGLPQNFRELLGAAIDEVVEKQAGYELRKREAVRITKALDSIVKRGRQEVACVDSIVRMMCRSDSVRGPETLRAWVTARRAQKVARSSSGADGEGVKSKPIPFVPELPDELKLDEVA